MSRIMICVGSSKKTSHNSFNFTQFFIDSNPLHLSLRAKNNLLSGLFSRIEIQQVLEKLLKISSKINDEKSKFYFKLSKNEYSVAILV